jgi:NAD(P) transhydrogenase
MAPGDEERCMSDFDFDLVSIGSGPAGQRAAVQAAKLGRRAAVIERSSCVGGVCIDTGTIPSKTLREAVLRCTGGTELGQRLPQARPKSAVTAAELLCGVGAVMTREIAVIENQLQRNGVTRLHGEASFLGPHRLLLRSKEGCSELTAAHIVIAVGTHPAPTPGVAPDGEIVFDSDQILRLKDLPRSIAVVGAGVIGTEYASMFAALGVPVTLVERRDRPLEFLDREIVDELIHQLRGRGVTFRLGECVESLTVSEGPRRQAVLHLESGKRLVTDAVLFSAGRMAATDRLNLSACGLSADSRGRLAVDECFRTAVPHIFAAGDVIGYPSLAATSAEQGRLAACQAFGVAVRPMAPHFPFGIYAIPEISMVGPPEHELTAQRVPYETGVARYREIARGQILGDESGFFKMLFHREDRRLLAVHCLGTGATELVHVGQAVLALGGGLDYFLETVFNYPTLAECYKVAALDASNKLRAN